MLRFFLVILQLFFGALVGATILSAMVIGWHAYSNTFDPYAIRDGQFEGFALMGTIPCGALFGVISATIRYAVINHVRCNSRNDAVTWIAFAAISISESILFLVGSSALIMILAFPSGMGLPFQIVWKDNPAGVVVISTIAILFCFWGAFRLASSYGRNHDSDRNRASDRSSHV